MLSRLHAYDNRLLGDASVRCFGCADIKASVGWVSGSSFAILHVGEGLHGHVAHFKGR